MSLEKILSKVETAKKDSGRLNDKINVIAVSKVQPLARIKKVLERRTSRCLEKTEVQESLEKWPKLINEYGKIELHLVGALQTNKVKDAMNLFDVIHSIDREKLIVKISNEAQNLGFLS